MRPSHTVVTYLKWPHPPPSSFSIPYRFRRPETRSTHPQISHRCHRLRSASRFHLIPRVAAETLCNRRRGAGRAWPPPPPVISSRLPRHHFSPFDEEKCHPLFPCAGTGGGIASTDGRICFNRQGWWWAATAMAEGKDSAGRRRRRAAMVEAT